MRFWLKKRSNGKQDLSYLAVLHHHIAEAVEKNIETDIQAFAREVAELLQRYFNLTPIDEKTDSSSDILTNLRSHLRTVSLLKVLLISTDSLPDWLLEERREQYVQNLITHFVDEETSVKRQPTLELAISAGKRREG